MLQRAYDIYYSMIRNDVNGIHSITQIERALSLNHVHVIDDFSYVGPIDINVAYLRANLRQK